MRWYKIEMTLEQNDTRINYLNDQRKNCERLTTLVTEGKTPEASVDI